jgi:hypothetical protein
MFTVQMTETDGPTFNVNVRARTAIKDYIWKTCHELLIHLTLIEHLLGPDTGQSTENKKHKTQSYYARSNQHQ